MDPTTFDRLSRAITTRRSRRSLAHGLVAASLLGAGGALALPAMADATARRSSKRHRAQAEKKKKKGKKSPFCLNGQTVQGSKKNRKKLLKRGATPGACAACAANRWVNATQFGSVGAGLSNFDLPRGIALSPDTLTAYIAEAGNHRVSVWTRPSASSAVWTAQTSFGAFGTGSGKLQFPAGVAVTPNGLTAVVADTSNHRVSVWTRPDTTSVWANTATFGANGSGASQFNSPTGVSITPDGLFVAVADRLNSRASIWSRPNTGSAFTNQTMATGAADLTYPRGVSLTPDAKTLLITDSYKDRVSVWTRPSPSSAFSNQTAFGTAGAGAGNLEGPLGVALASNGLTAFVADTENSRVAVWTRPSPDSAAWNNTLSFGQNGAGPADLNMPAGLAIAPDGQTLWIADENNNRVSVWAKAC
ncbi:MAG: NHL repeat-containing protein [Thermomicrobiales bacterium]